MKATSFSFFFVEYIGCLVNYVVVGFSNTDDGGVVGCAVSVKIKNRKKKFSLNLVKKKG